MYLIKAIFGISIIRYSRVYSIQHFQLCTMQYVNTIFLNMNIQLSDQQQNSLSHVPSRLPFTNKANHDPLRHLS